MKWRWCVLHWIDELFDLRHSRAEAWLRKVKYPWEMLDMIGRMLQEMKLPETEFEQIAEGVWAARDAKIAASAGIAGPCVIGHETEVRHCAFIRGNALVGDGCVVGNSVELKNCILFDGVQVPHFNYVGDSILGYKAHMGAGAVTSNVKSDKSLVVVRAMGEEILTGRKKLGAMVGDLAEIGCNSVLNPGTVIGKESVVYPVSCVRGWVPGGHIYKNQACVTARRK